ncbi:MAG TPA: lamin tail domain-containing protein [Pyrinomonadaceae bacterium]|nr:lamin tail domain-containing protein [Pyrinomonadaceae bacterium]
MNNPVLRRRHTLRQLTAASLCLVLLGQIVVLSGQEQSQKVLVKKSSKKKKRQRSDKFATPLILPPLSAPSNNTAGTSVTQLSNSKTNSKARVSTQSVTKSALQNIQATAIHAVSTTKVSLRTLTTKRKGLPTTTVLPINSNQLLPAPRSIQEVHSPVVESLRSTSLRADIPVPLTPSPVAVQSFQGESDEAKGGGPVGTFTTPPDTMGAVGINKVVSYVNNNIVVQDKSTGAQLSLASLDAFWAASGGTNTFDPRIQYDPYNNRWLIAAVSNAQTASSSILFGISETEDPQGTFTLFRFVVGCAPGAAGCDAQGEWADFPMLGFNKSWVAIGWNQFTTTTNEFIDGRMLVIDYPTIRGGIANATGFSGSSDFCLHPATTLSPTEDTLYVPVHVNSADATYRLHRITGSPSTPVFNADLETRIRPGGSWTQPNGDVLPQQCIPGVGAPTQTCPATLRGADVGDSFIRSNVVFRNGKIYYPQTIALPAGALTIDSHFAAQWTVLNTDGTFFDGGRVEDPAATGTNGGMHYAYPSLTVNKNNDVLLGFSKFQSDDYIDAGYAYRLGTDPPGAMRDPVIYKEGEDYYSKSFSGSRNRWGDYSHTVVDPVNDRDMWTIQEYAKLRVGSTGQGSNDSRWGTWWAKVAAPAGSSDLLISEFRLRGLNGANDEFIEIYNNSGSQHTVNSSDGSAGYAVAASDGTVRFTIPNGTVIPAKGHYLGVNNAGYSLASYPAGNGTTATGDAAYTIDIPDNAGIALFSTATPANFSLATRIDAVGSTAEGNMLYKEGAGYPSLTPFSIDYAFYRSFCPGNTPVFGTALGCFPGSGGQPKDSNDNAADIVFVDTAATVAGAGKRLGAPGPENLSSPLERNSATVFVLDRTVSSSLPPNRVRDFTSDSINNSTFGTLDIRRRVQNTTGITITRLRFRIIDLNTLPAPGGFADLRARSSTAVFVFVSDPGTCFLSEGACVTTVNGTTLEQPPSQPLGGAFNSTLSAGTITLANPLFPGFSTNVRFLLGVQQPGSFRFFINIEALP